MALATRCPHCQTTFRVANDQLKLHAGLVRCGACHQAFNGVEHLVAPDAVKATPGDPAAQSGSNAVMPMSLDARPATQSTDQAAAATEMQHGSDEDVAEKHISSSTVGTVTQADSPQVWSHASRAETNAPADEETLDEFALALREQQELERLQLQTESATQTTELPVGQAATVNTDAPAVSAAAIDFDLGDGMESMLPDSLSSEASIASGIEVETRAALASEPEIDWSVAEHGSEAGLLSAPVQQDGLLTAPLLADQPVSDFPLSDAEMHALSETNLPISLTEADELNIDNAAVSQAELTADDKPEFVLQAERAQKRKKILTIVYALLSIILLPALLAQVIYLNRNSIAAQYPETKPGLQKACAVLACQISLPAKIDQITIEANELISQDSDKNLFQLTVQLQNHSTMPMSWPHIELILNDAKDKTVIQKSFSPKEYLSEVDELGKGIAAGSDKNIKIYFELPKLKASGYHVGAFYP
ncbi:DUF3426 domain-containing protein [Undibacterium rugosum]|uniref:DUF3426 domain-containing protein n=2 Tax=Undibacterium TaxID=401469 RepID=A0A923I6Z0_9BURK|nr:DUF3426 domain-containing protein [Undibacterium rugosum]MBC3934708.1 DUF3426 domain-containing protein [Undibacterium rugosum]MBR7779742.1 DUF3426 domain-containing protein [Undibacterium rugosum]